MTTICRIHFALTLLLIAAAPGSAQPADKASSPSAMSKAAGMALRDGALAPGMVTVRVVRGSFSNNLTGVPVVVDVPGGKVERAETDRDGRAHFAHLPIGATARAFATVDGNRIESDSFEIPSESGVRLLLVVGEGPVTAVGMPADSASAQPPLAPPPAAALAQAPEQAAPGAPAMTDRTAARTVQIAVIAATILTFVLVFGLRVHQTAGRQHRGGGQAAIQEE